MIPRATVKFDVADSRLNDANEYVSRLSYQDWQLSRLSENLFYLRLNRFFF